MKNIFDPQTTNELIGRINALNPDTPVHWGKMTVDQMLAHSIVAYNITYMNKYPKPNTFMHFILMICVKDEVVNETPYPKNSRTTGAFIISEHRNFEKEKSILISYF
jgi:hypothetical protein